MCHLCYCRHCSAIAGCTKQAFSITRERLKVSCGCKSGPLCSEVLLRLLVVFEMIAFFVNNLVFLGLLSIFSMICDLDFLVWFLIWVFLISRTFLSHAVSYCMTRHN